MPKPKDEWTSVSQDIATELDADAKILAPQVLGSPGPDHHSMPDTEAAQHILAAYQRGDRTFLTTLALQGPEQFLRVWKSLGGTVPNLAASPQQQQPHA